MAVADVVAWGLVVLNPIARQVTGNSTNKSLFMLLIGI